jgi:hypothetical protein
MRQNEQPMAGSSRFIRTTWMLSATRTLDLPNFGARIRLMSMQEAEELADLIRRRNVFARHSYENNFYVQRAHELGEMTIVEVVLPGEPDDVIPRATPLADAIERVAVLSTVFATSRARLHRQLAISSHQRFGIDLTIGPDCYYLRSSSRREPRARGVSIDQPFQNRFSRLPLQELIHASLSDDPLARRISTALGWLFESRRDAAASAALVKTAIALESLLIHNQTEPLTASLSDRAAMILTKDAQMRRKVSRAVKDFYAARSVVVHGRGRRSGQISAELIEGADRLVMLLCLTIAANGMLWNSIDRIIDWCEGERWGDPANGEIHALAQSLVRGALALLEGKKGS